MIRVLTITALLLLLASPVAARDLDPSAGNNGVTGRGAGNKDSGSGNNGHPNAVGKRFSYPGCSTSCGGASGKHGSQGKSGAGSYGGGSSGNGNGNGNDPGGYGNTGRL